MGAVEGLLLAVEKGRRQGETLLALLVRGVAREQESASILRGDEGGLGGLREEQAGAEGSAEEGERRSRPGILF